MFVTKLSNTDKIIKDNSPLTTVICSSGIALANALYERFQAEKVRPLLVALTMLLSICSLLFFLVGLNIASASIENVTVDDAASDSLVIPSYLPVSGIWKEGSGCSGCRVHPDASQAFNGTWHDATFHPSNEDDVVVEVTFTGESLGCPRRGIWIVKRTIV